MSHHRKQFITQLAFNTHIVAELKNRMGRDPKPMTPSKYQQDILSWAQMGKGSAIVRAVAGSGKTTLLEMLMRAIKREGDGLHIKTLNSLGNSAVFKRLGKTKLEENKIGLIARGFMEPDEREDYGPEVLRMVGLAKAYGLAPDGLAGVSGLVPDTEAFWRWFIEQFDMDIKEQHIHAAISRARDILKYSILDLETIDYNDQKYLPVIKDWPLWRNDWLLVDEAQDMSPIDLALACKALKPGGRMIAVGDESQSIYAFRGADHESMGNVAKAFNAQHFPLSISYRCAKAIVKRAQALVPIIEAAPNAPEGEDTQCDLYCKDLFEEGDLVVCRNTAPVVKLAYGLLAQGLAVTVLGRDIGGNLIRLIEKLKPTSLTGADPHDIYDDCLVARLETWVRREIERLTKKGQEAKIQAVEDKVDTLNVFIESSGASTVVELKQHIDLLFTQAGPVTLCTVHKAKGLEAERVFILNASMMPSPWARSEHALLQEKNIEYVAITRAKQMLCDIEGEGLVTPEELAAADRAKAERDAVAPATETICRMVVPRAAADEDMVRYAWIIDGDALSDPENGEPLRNGTVGPARAPQALVDRLAAGEGLLFRMLDDDRELCYHGRFIDDDGSTVENLSNYAFGPLDDFGTPDAGCTIIEYRDHKGRWETL